MGRKVRLWKAGGYSYYRGKGDTNIGGVGSSRPRRERLPPAEDSKDISIWGFVVALLVCLVVYLASCGALILIVAWTR